MKKKKKKSIEKVRVPEPREERIGAGVRFDVLDKGREEAGIIGVV